MSALGGAARAYYRLLLLAYPREFRRRDGIEAAFVFSEACRESSVRGGRLAVLRRLLHASAEVPRRGLNERLRRARGPMSPRHRRPRRRAALTLLAELAADLRFAARSLRRRPGWTLAIAVTLALGIGANTAIFSVMDATLLAASPWPDADRVVYVHARFEDTDTSIDPLVEDLFRWHREVGVFDRLEARAGVIAVLSHAEGALQVSGAWVTSGYLDALGIEPIVGRFLRADDARPDAQPVVVMPEVTWRRLYGADDDVVGRIIELDGVAHVVIGVAPSVPEVADVFHAALPNPGSAAGEPGAQRARGIAWLRPGISIEEASARLAAVSRGEDERWGRYTGHLYRPGNDFWRIEEFRSGLLALSAAVFLVLTIACVNVASLMLASAETRRGELAMRAALGAGRARLTRFLLTESLLLSILGGALGVAVAFGAIALMRLAPPGGQLGEALEHVRVNGTVLAYATSIAVLAGLAFGLVPALRGSSRRHGVLQEADARSGGGRTGLRRALVAAETALSLVLLVAAGLTVRSFVELRFADPGFDADRIMAIGIRLPTTRYADPSSQQAFFTALTAAVRQIPGVQSVSLGTGAKPPSDLVTGGEMVIEGREGPAQEMLATVSNVEGSFLAFMGIPLLAGRDLTAADVRGVRSAPERPVVVNRSMAERYWPDGDAIGARFMLSYDYNQRWNRVVGIAADVAQQGFEVPRDGLHMYWPMVFDGRYSELLVRLRPGVPPPVAALRDVLNRLDPQIPSDGLETAAAALLDSMSGTRFRAALFGVFGAVALALAAVGIFGVVAYTVVQRTAEMGVRLALGAAPRDVRRLMLLGGSVPVLVGVAVGLPVALGVTRLMSGFLVGVATSDPITYAATAAVLVAVGTIATWLPAQRATKVDPALTLRRG